MNVSYQEMSAALETALGLSQPPLAVCFADKIPSGVEVFSGRVAAGCQFWQSAAVSAFATSARDHDLCAIGLYTHNLESSSASQTDLSDALGIFKLLRYVTDEDLSQIPVLESRPRHIIYAPLAQTPLAPDVVLLIVNASQALVLAEATAQVEKQNAPAMGRPACAVVPQVMQSGRAALSLGCCGARAYLDVLNENNAVFAIPGARIGIYTERIQKLASANQLLARFHELRRRDIASGLLPTVKDSLATLASS